MPHGGPHARSRLSYDDFAQFLSTRGYIVVEPNFRGSTGYGYDFERAGYKQWGGVMQDDLTDALEFMVRKGYTDPEKVCIVGTSYGGYAALMGAIKTPALYKCAISLNGVTHLEKLIRYNMKEVVDKAEWDVALFDRIGHPEKDKELLDANSPALHADKITIPVMIVAGSADNVVPYSQAKLMVKALEKAGAKFEFIRLKDTGHNPFYYVEDMELVFEAVEKFLDSHLR
jgi:dipeptidyl aminopeptidase/acylaminoacyl peptidase